MSVRSSSATSLGVPGGVMEFDQKAVAERIERAFIVDWEMEPSVAHDVAFHMTDWLGDLAHYTDFCQHPDSMSEEAVTSLVTAFIAHVPEHMVAAHKLVMDLPVADVFGIGALDDDSDA